MPASKMAYQRSSAPPTTNYISGLIGLSAAHRGVM
ncbi:hypothetical protein BofuT4_uP148540.1 [Botrytis cinerea T4]|uniref:Uncharacterized protein n=1 Tax=Botryotinia fuckeliana (strain T4) TaxID=999810 RepID=G2YX06_BOTF4|nr:hypothetical protein BofuT4_uP148540.1 [Botrytis cinerea T4]